MNSDPYIFTFLRFIDPIYEGFKSAVRLSWRLITRPLIAFNTLYNFVNRKEYEDGQE